MALPLSPTAGQMQARRQVKDKLRQPNAYSYSQPPARGVPARGRHRAWFASVDRGWGVGAGPHQKYAVFSRYIYVKSVRTSAASLCEAVATRSAMSISWEGAVSAARATQNHDD